MTRRRGTAPRTALRTALRPLMRPATIAALVAVQLGLVGCDASPERGSSRGARAPLMREAVPRASDPDLTAPALPLPPALDGACVAGDHDLGEPWRLEGSAAASLVLGSLDALTVRDSARFVARIARMVDALPNDTVVADFRGLPVTIRVAWRVVPAEGDTVVAARVVRRLPMESAPVEESHFVLAVPGTRQGVREPLLERWVARDAGAEDLVAVRELAAVLQRADTVWFVVARDDATTGAPDGSSVRVEWVARRGAAWRLEWQGDVPRCRVPLSGDPIPPVPPPARD